MTQWMGDLKVTTKLAGPHGGRVRVGRFILPRHVFVEIAGGNGHPDLHMHLEWREDRPQVVELSISAKADGRGVRSSDLEVLALDGIARSVFQGEAMIVQEDLPGGVTSSAFPDWSDPRFERDLWEVDRLLTESIATTRSTRSRAELERVAEVYQRHRGKGALLAVAAALGVSERTAARRVKDARLAGLIAKGDADGEH
jgi:hypothetical protein